VSLLSPCGPFIRGRFLHCRFSFVHLRQWTDGMRSRYSGAINCMAGLATARPASLHVCLTSSMCDRAHSQWGAGGCSAPSTCKEFAECSKPDILINSLMKLATPCHIHVLPLSNCRGAVLYSTLCNGSADCVFLTKMLLL
jgi:hypothetical protein